MNWNFELLVILGYNLGWTFTLLKCLKLKAVKRIMLKLILISCSVTLSGRMFSTLTLKVWREWKSAACYFGGPSWSGNFMWRFYSFWHLLFMMESVIKLLPETRGIFNKSYCRIFNSYGIFFQIWYWSKYRKRSVCFK